MVALSFKIKQLTHVNWTSNNSISAKLFILIVIGRRMNTCVDNSVVSLAVIRVSLVTTDGTTPSCKRYSFDHYLPE